MGRDHLGVKKEERIFLVPGARQGVILTLPNESIRQMRVVAITAASAAAAVAAAILLFICVCSVSSGNI